MSFDRHESSVKLCIKWGAGVFANESAECGIRSSRAATAEPIAEKASPANSLARPCEPFVNGATVQLWGVFHGALDGTRRVWVVEIFEEPFCGRNGARGLYW